MLPEIVAGNSWGGPLEARERPPVRHGYGGAPSGHEVAGVEDGHRGSLHGWPTALSGPGRVEKRPQAATWTGSRPISRAASASSGPRPAVEPRFYRLLDL